MITTNELMAIAFPVVILLGILLWLSVFSTTYRKSGHLDERNKKLTGIFNATLISLAITDAVYIALLIILRSI